MEILDTLRVIVNVLLAVFLIFLIYFTITITNSIKRLTNETEQLLRNTNILIDDVQDKMLRLNVFFDLIDSISLKVEYVNDRVNDTFYGIINYVAGLFDKVFSRFSKKSEEAEY